MTTYKKIKAMIVEGLTPRPVQFERAIQHQTAVLARAAGSLAKHAAKLKAAEFHPFPLPEDQMGRVARRAQLVMIEQSRLVRLYFWKEVAELAPKTAPQGSGKGAQE